jgi:hypothetical protein
MFLMAAIRQPSAPRVSISVVHIARVPPPAIPEISYRPSAIATPGATNRTDVTVMVRFPPELWELAIVPRTTSLRPLRHSPLDTSWSASLVNNALARSHVLLNNLANRCFLALCQHQRGWNQAA